MMPVLIFLGEQGSLFKNDKNSYQNLFENKAEHAVQSYAAGKAYIPMLIPSNAKQFYY